MIGDLARLLTAHRFQRLFVEVLGWDYSFGTVEVSAADRRFSFQRIAQKRGFQVLHCQIDRLAIINRGLLRKVQRRVARVVHEHILIYSSKNPPRQVWQWAVRLSDGRRLRHREPLFLSHSPPPSLLRRLAALAFRFDEEKGVSLVDAVERVRRALGGRDELNLSVKHPSYAERSDELIRAMREGQPGAFERFVLFHQSLAEHWAKRMRWIGVELEDLQQIAKIGLIEAARRFRPEFGFDFSTYAIWWMRQSCQRYGPQHALWIRLPARTAWACLRLRDQYRRLVFEQGPDRAATEVRAAVQSEVGMDYWRHFRRATTVASLSDRKSSAYREARRLVDPDADVVQAVIRLEQAELVREAVGWLPERQKDILRLRYGMGVQTQTLEEIGKRLNLTRERVRQIQKQAEKRVKRLIVRRAPSFAVESARPDAQETPQADESETPRIEDNETAGFAPAVLAATSGAASRHEGLKR